MHWSLSVSIMFLPSYASKSRRDLAERAIVMRRDYEAQRMQKCDSTAKYYNDIHIKSAVYRNLEDPNASSKSRANQESNKEDMEYLKKKKQLEERRMRLKVLLSEESEKYMREMKGKLNEERERDPWNLTQLKEQVEELRRKRTAEEKQVAEKKAYQQWKLNSPYAREFESKLLQREVLQAWEDKKKEQEREANERKEEEEREKAEIELQRFEAQREAEELEQKRKQEAKRWAETLRHQMNEVVLRNKEADELKAEEAELFKLQKDLEDLREKRKKALEVQRKKELRISLLMQSKEKIRKMAAEIHQELEMDQQTLDYLLQLEQRQNEKEKLRRKLAMTDVEWMKSAVAEQLALERMREEEMKILYQEEAARMWSQREAQWERERKARDQLMNEVLEGLRKQINEKIAHNLSSQEELLKERENLLQNLEDDNNKARQEERHLLTQREVMENRAKELEEKLRPRICIPYPDPLRRRP